MSSHPSISLADKAHDALREMIGEGRIRIEPISEVRLAGQIQVSRTPVREAVRRLVGENILEVTLQGVRLYLPSVEDLAEVYYTRAILEGAAARRAATLDGAALAKRLRSILDVAEPLLDMDDHDAFARLNGQFHSAIVAASGNRRVRELLGSLETIIVRYRADIVALPRASEAVVRRSRTHCRSPGKGAAGRSREPDSRPHFASGRPDRARDASDRRGNRRSAFNCSSASDDGRVEAKRKGEAQ